jgi:Fe2+ or Zn2+ uptake regulation protein/O6-methylguanine-DNA--protein-cysteine methyltransferase
VPPDVPDPAATLREKGLRSTPQRRAILGAFIGGRTEHLSSEEVHARATLVLPDLSRATVYATLAEFAELGLIGAVGAAEPVRYETNTDTHDHFRCRLCLRLFDLERGRRVPDSIVPAGFNVERIEVRAEGICADCTDYGAGLAAGAAAIIATSPNPAAFDRPGVAAAEISSPLGPLFLGANQDGLFRIAFEEHTDAGRLRDLASRRRGGAAARAHLERAASDIEGYFGDEPDALDTPIDWDSLPPDWVDSLRACREVPFAARRSFLPLLGKTPPRVGGEAFGANPVPIVIPCHRVTRGIEIPEPFVGGPWRRRLLLAHERDAPRTSSS